MPQNLGKGSQAKLNTDQEKFKALDELEAKNPEKFAEILRKSEAATKSRTTDPEYDIADYSRNPNFSEKIRMEQSKAKNYKSR